MFPTGLNSRRARHACMMLHPIIAGEKKGDVGGISPQSYL